MKYKGEKILKVIQENQPVHLSRIARIADIPLSTVHYHLKNKLRGEVICTIMEGKTKPNTTMYSLKEKKRDEVEL